MKNRYPLLISAILCFCSCSENSIRSLLERRSRRALIYPNPRGSETKVQVLFGLGLPMEEEISMTLGYVLKCNYDLPYNSSQLRPSFSERQQLSRWNLYRLLESTLGKSCLLRMVCEAAAVPFLSRDSQGTTGLLGELLHALLTPSMTREEYEIYADREYTTAEEKGRGEGCRMFLQDCPKSPLDYFSRRMRLARAFETASMLPLLTFLLVTPSVDTASKRERRYLVFPPPGDSATKVQLVFGLGIPMEVEVSTIVGYVMKCNYNLPYNASSFEPI
ncbi:hypothetical protein TSAR_011364 [Trichomalopsis sarcophagae]|uniref:Uncharacterized protein n=1 Tax=Trichomalopsis sarcophagae TaxID=543379 RepID=A0A232EV40_9HYME|nr:hypothetical protein TSAR_011364 [Trichomalopsis sarcophagae]